MPLTCAEISETARTLAAAVLATRSADADKQVSTCMTMLIEAFVLDHRRIADALEQLVSVQWDIRDGNCFAPMPMPAP